MEETIETNLPQIRCSKLNMAVQVCTSKKCSNQIFLCLNTDCQPCRKNHKKCMKYELQQLISQIVIKRQKITPQVEKAILRIQKIYDQAIDQLSIDKQNNKAKIQFFGLNDYEVEFMRKLQDGCQKQINGKLIHQIMKNVSIKKQFLATQESIQKFWDKKKHTIDLIFEELKNRTLKKPNSLDSLICDQGDRVFRFFKKPIINTELMYRASLNGFSTSTFHSICDGMADTLVLAKTQYDKIIGGFTPLKWKSDSNYQVDNKAQTFLFSISNNEKYPLTNYQQYAIYGSSGYGPTFGGGHDFYIANEANNNRSSYFNVPYSYNLKKKDQKQNENSERLNQSVNSNKISVKQQSSEVVLNPQRFIGSESGYYCKIIEWQVFKIQFGEEKKQDKVEKVEKVQKQEEKKEEEEEKEEQKEEEESDKKTINIVENTFDQTSQ